MTRKIWTKTDELARGMRKPINTAAISIMGAYTFLWGLWLTLPMDSFLGSPVVKLFYALAPEWVWGVAAMVIGILMLRGVIKNKYRTLVFGAAAGFYFWLVITIFFFIGAWTATPWITALMVAIYCAFVAINLRVNKASLHDNK